MILSNAEVKAMFGRDPNETSFTWLEVRQIMKAVQSSTNEETEDRIVRAFESLVRKAK